MFEAFGGQGVLGAGEAIAIGNATHLQRLDERGYLSVPLIRRRLGTPRVTICVLDHEPHQVMRCGRLRALQEHIVVRVGTGVHILGGL